MLARVEACIVYPVKACAGLVVDELRVDASGDVRGDREWVVVDASGTVTWLGALPRLVLLQPALRNGRTGLAHGGAFVPLPGPGEGRPCELAAWDGAAARHVTMGAEDAGDAVARFASEVAGAPVRVARPRVPDHRVNPLHLASVRSVREALALASDDEARAALPRFRANLVLGPVADDMPPFIEDHARAVVFDADPGAPRLEVYAPCERCVCVDVDPATAATGRETLAAVARESQRRAPRAPVQFGVYARAAGAGVVRRGTLCRLELDF